MTRRDDTRAARAGSAASRKPLPPEAGRARERQASARRQSAVPTIPPLTRSATLAAAVIAAACVAFTVTYLLNEPDFWQHLTVGREIWRTHAVPNTQLWTWPTYGAPDINSSWGFRALVYPFWAAGGGVGLFVWKWLTTLGSFALLVMTARRMGARGVTPFVIAVIGALAWRGRSQIRPETWVAILLSLELWILETRRSGGPNRTAALPAVALVWANSHISYYLGFVILGAYTIDAWVRGRREALANSEGAPLAERGPDGGGPGTSGAKRRLPPALALVLLGSTGIALSFVNPFGWRALWWPVDFFLHQRHEPIYATIGELERIRWSENLWNGAPIFVFGWPLLALLRWRRRGLDVAETILAVAFVGSALVSVRFLGFLALAATPFIARDLADLLGGFTWPRALATPRARATLACITCVAVGLPQWSRMHPGVGVEWRNYPVQACDFMAEHGVRGRGYNTFSFGGYVLWRFFPERDRLPFMDIHQAGTPEIRRLYTFSLQKPEYWHELDGKLRFEWALVARLTFAEDRLPDILDADPSWALVFEDDAALLFVRRTGPLGALAERFAYRVVPAGNLKLAALSPVLGRDPSLRTDFRAELERMTRESPYTSQAHTMLAELARAEGRLADARTEMQAAVAANPRDAELRKRLRELESGAGR